MTLIFLHQECLPLVGTEDLADLSNSQRRFREHVTQSGVIADPTYDLGNADGRKWPFPGLCSRPPHHLDKGRLKSSERGRAGQPSSGTLTEAIEIFVENQRNLHGRTNCHQSNRWVFSRPWAFGARVSPIAGLIVYGRILSSEATRPA